MVDMSKADSASGSSRLTDRISLGVLAATIPRDLIDEILAETNRREQRSRRLPAHVMVHFCLAMCLFYDDDYEEVMRQLVGSLQDMDSWRDEWVVPSTSAITQARHRLGEEPLRVLFDRVAVPVAARGTKGAWLGSRRLMAVDGFMLDVADTPDNAREFDRLEQGPKASAFPQVRVVALTECGSHAAVGAAVGPCRTDERALLGELLGTFEPDMLVSADRKLVRHEALRRIPGSAGRNWRSIPGSNGLPGFERRSGTGACQQTGGRVQADGAMRWGIRMIWLKLNCLKPNLQWRQGPARRKIACNRRRLRVSE